MSEGREWSEYARKRRVFILGAGFSAAAGIPMTATLLSRAMDRFSMECPGIYQRVCNYAQDVQWDKDEPDFSEIAFSELCTHLEFAELREYAGGERWSDAGSREKLAIRFYLAKSVQEETPVPDRIPQVYIDFVEQLNDGDIIITFNWDILLELAIERAGKSFTYNFRERGIKLAKLHGSINWRLAKATNHLGREINTLDWKPIGFANGGMIEIDLYFSAKLSEMETWNQYRPLGELQPFLVLPGYGKAFDVRSVSSLWYRPEFTFAACRDIYIIGLSVSQDDHFIRSFFLNNFPMEDRQTFIINPDASASTNYRFMLRDQNVKLIQEKFSRDHVKLMQTRME